MRFDESIAADLADLRERGLHRDPGSAMARDDVARTAARVGTGLLDASSNDYLGFASAAPVSRATSVQGADGPQGGAGASRLIHGTRAAHLAVERRLAEWVGADCALLASSGFAANVGLIPALVGAEDVVFSDELNHASLIDGCRLSRARVVVVPHLDAGALSQKLLGARDARRRLVVTESYFSMDADSPDLRGLRALCTAHDAALVVDEAHALGVHGPGGAGLCAEARICPDVLVGTLGKAFGLSGAFVATSTVLHELLWNRWRSFVYSTATPPSHAQALEARLGLLQRADDRRQRLASNIARLERGLGSLPLALPRGRHGPVFPILFESPAAAQTAAASLACRGILAQAIRPPTVPPGTSRLRITVTAHMADADVDRLLQALGDL